MYYLVLSLIVSIFPLRKENMLLYQEVFPQKEGIAVYGSFVTKPDGTKTMTSIDTVWMKGGRAKFRQISFNDTTCYRDVWGLTDHSTHKHYTMVTRPSFNDTLYTEYNVAPLEGKPAKYKGRDVMAGDCACGCYYSTDPDLMGDFSSRLMLEQCIDLGYEMREVILLSLKFCPVSDKDMAFKLGGIRTDFFHCSPDTEHNGHF